MPHTAPVSPDEIQRHPRVSAARDHIIATDERTLRDQIDLTELPAPPFGEEARAEKMLELLAETGLSDVRADEAGNVIGVRLGQAADPAGAPLVLARPPGRRGRRRRPYSVRVVPQRRGTGWDLPCSLHVIAGRRAYLIGWSTESRAD